MKNFLVKSLALVAVLSCVADVYAATYKFTAPAPSGQTLSFEYVVDSDSSYVWVTCGSLHYNVHYNNAVAYPNLSGHVIIPDSVEYNGAMHAVVAIGSMAFSRCSSLTKITLGKNIRFLGASSFYNCNGLDSIISQIEIPPEIENLNIDGYGDVFGGSANTGATVVVPCESIEDYRSVWGTTFNYICYPTLYTLTVQSSDTTMGTVTGSGLYAEGTDVTITAEPYDGYQFVRWQDGNTQISRNITVTADSTFTAFFESIVPEEYTITVISHSTTMGIVTGGGTFTYGTLTTITAEPYEGYVFVQWQDGNTEDIRTITVTADASYTAYFRADGTQGIDDVSSCEMRIYSLGSEIVVVGAEESDVLIYDVMGRIVHKGRIEAPIHVNTMGVYMVKVGERQPQKVVVR